MKIKISPRTQQNVCECKYIIKAAIFISGHTILKCHFQRALHLQYVHTFGGSEMDL